MGFLRKFWPTSFATLWFLVLASGAGQASPTLVVDADSGDVLYQDMATAPWFPASTTKLMTVYVALSAVREGRITFDTPLVVSPRAAVMPPSKMGFRPGTLVTLDNALKMLMVKSPNDVAVTIAEGISGSVEAFADDMNVYATRIGLHESHFVNPNGLPDEHHMSSARDMALIARALLRDFPEQRGLFGIGVLAFGNQLISNHNGLLGRYPGVDGMKTGYTCSAGYNVVLSAERNGKHLIAVIMGAPSNSEKNERAAALFDRFFADSSRPIATLDTLPNSGSTAPPDLRPIICGRGRGAAIAQAMADDRQIAPPGPDGRPVPPESRLLPVREAFTPVRVSVGPVPGWTGRIAQAIGSGAKEIGSAPVKSVAADAVRKPVEQPAAREASAQGPVEAPAPAPMALVGATPMAPAALATKRFVKSTPSLSLAVGKAPHARGKKAKAVVEAETDSARPASKARPTPVHKTMPKPTPKPGKAAQAKPKPTAAK